jgi:hypothetical protein
MVLFAIGNEIQSCCSDHCSSFEHSNDVTHRKEQNINRRQENILLL